MTITEALKLGKSFTDCIGNPMRHIFTGNFPHPAKYIHIFIGNHAGVDGTNWHAFVDDNGVAYNIHTGETYDKECWVSIKKEKRTVWVNMWHNDTDETRCSSFPYNNMDVAIKMAQGYGKLIGTFPIEIEI